MLKENVIQQCRRSKLPPPPEPPTGKPVCGTEQSGGGTEQSTCDIEQSIVEDIV